MAEIFLLIAKDKASHSTTPTKILRAYDDEVLATEAKLLIEDCEPRKDIEVIKVQMVTAIKPTPLPNWSAAMPPPYSGTAIGRRIEVDTPPEAPPAKCDGRRAGSLCPAQLPKEEPWQ